MKSRFERFDRVYGLGSADILAEKNILIFGIGGVGSYAAEALIRCGIGNMTIVDKDIVDITNTNRQIEAITENIGKKKVEVFSSRLKSINPEVKINEKYIFYDKNTVDDICFIDYDYIVDAIDSIDSKVLIIKKAKEENIGIISSMGMGNKIDPSRIKIVDIKKTHTDPLARIMRRKLKDCGINQLDVVFSEEKPIRPIASEDKAPGSTAFVPSVAGLYIASYVVNYLLGSVYDGKNWNRIGT